MHTESSDTLRQWGTHIEQALGIPLGIREDGAFALRSKGGALVGAEPMPGTLGVALNGGTGRGRQFPLASYAARPAGRQSGTPDCPALVSSAWRRKPTR